MGDASRFLPVMVDAARKAGEGLQADFRQLSALEVRTKAGPSDLVSIADENAERICRSILCASEPDFQFMGEESGGPDTAADGLVWIVDPLDGTTNFLYGNPLWGVNVALARDGEVIAAVTFIPELNELYTAALGGGAHLNKAPISVSARSDVSESLLSCGMPFAGKPFQAEFVREMEMLAPKVAGIRRTGACAVDMAWVASGRWDAYWERYTNAWDMAPGVLLVQEAGGRVTNVRGQTLDIFANNVCVSNGHIHSQIINILNKATQNEEASQC